MNLDVRVKRAQFINNCVELRDVFSFAEPQQVLTAVNKYLGHHYGSMLWDQDSDMVGQYCRSWSTCVKLTYNVPRSTHTFLVENLLAVNFVPIKTEIMARYGKFFTSLRKCKSPEVRQMAEIVRQDVRSTTGKNLTRIRRKTGVNTVTVPSMIVRETVPRAEVPVYQEWRLSLLETLLKQRREMDAQMVDTSLISDMIDSLCSS